MAGIGSPPRFILPARHIDAVTTTPRFVLPGSSVRPRRLVPPSSRPLQSSSPERDNVHRPVPTSRPLHSSSPERRLMPSPPRRSSDATEYYAPLSPQERQLRVSELGHFPRAGRIFEARIFRDAPAGGALVDARSAPLEFDFLISGINYAHLEAASTSPQNTGLNPHQLEDIIRGEILGVLHHTNVFDQEHQITFDVRTQAGTVESLSLQVESSPTSTISNVRILGGEWPVHVHVVAQTSHPTEGYRLQQFAPFLQSWLSSTPFQNTLLYIKSLLGPEVRAKPTITEVRVNGKKLSPLGNTTVRDGGVEAASSTRVEPVWSGAQGMERFVGTRDASTSPLLVTSREHNAAASTRSPSWSQGNVASAAEALRLDSATPRTISIDVDDERSQSKKSEGRVDARVVRNMTSSLVESDDEIHSPKVMQVTSLHNRQMQRDEHRSHPPSSSSTFRFAKEGLQAASAVPSVVATASKASKRSIFSQLSASPTRTSPRSPQQDALSLLSRSATPTAIRSTVVSPRARRISTPSPSSPGRGRGGSAGSMLLRVSTSPMRSEDYYVVGGVQLSHVDVTVRVPVQVRSWRVCNICETQLRSLLLARRDMLEYYARDDLFDLLSQVSRDPAEGGSPRSAQAVLNCARHVMVTIDVTSAAEAAASLGETNGAARSVAPTVSIMFVCSILCESLVEKLLVSELWSSVERERLLIHAAQGTQMFRRLLKEVVAIIASGGQGSSRMRLDELPSLVTSVPASLKGCQLSIGGRVAWMGGFASEGVSAQRPHIAPHYRHSGGETEHSRSPSQQLSGAQDAHLHQFQSLRGDILAPQALRSPELTVRALPSDLSRSRSRSADHHPIQPHTTRRLQNELGPLGGDGDDREPTPALFSAAPTPLRSPTSTEGAHVVTLVLEFSQMPLQPLQNAMRWWAASAKQSHHHVVSHTSAGNNSNSPTEQIIRACQFDLLDGLQEFCFDPEDCAVRVAATDRGAAPEPGDKLHFASFTSLGATLSPAEASSNHRVPRTALRLVCKIRVSPLYAGHPDIQASRLQAAILAYLTSASQFAALRDVYAQLYFMTIDEEQQRGEAITPRSRTPPPRIVFPFLDTQESTFNGIPLRNMLRVLEQQSLR